MTTNNHSVLSLASIMFGSVESNIDLLARMLNCGDMSEAESDSFVNIYNYLKGCASVDHQVLNKIKSIAIIKGINV